MKTIEIFATDNAGSVGNVVTYSFNLNPATQLVFATTGEPPATAVAGAELRGSRRPWSSTSRTRRAASITSSTAR